MEVLKNIITEFNKVEIPSINSGGCALFATELHNNLLPLKPKLFIIARDDKAYATYAVKKYGLQGYGVPHMGVKIGKKYIDCRGVFNSFSAFCKNEEGYNRWGSTYIPVKLADVVKVKGWNPMFERRKYEKVLKEQIKLAVSKNLCPLLKDKFITKKK